MVLSLCVAQKACSLDQGLLVKVRRGTLQLACRCHRSRVCFKHTAHDAHSDPLTTAPPGHGLCSKLSHLRIAADTCDRLERYDRHVNISLSQGTTTSLPHSLCVPQAAGLHAFLLGPGGTHLHKTLSRFLPPIKCACCLCTCPAHADRLAVWSLDVVRTATLVYLEDVQDQGVDLLRFRPVSHA